MDIAANAIIFALSQGTMVRPKYEAIGKIAQCFANPQPGPARSQALLVELPCFSRRQAQREESLRSAGIEGTQLGWVADPPNGPSRVGAKTVHSIRWRVRRSRKRNSLLLEGHAVWGQTTSRDPLRWRAVKTAVPSEQRFAKQRGRETAKKTTGRQKAML